MIIFGGCTTIFTPQQQVTMDQSVSVSSIITSEHNKYFDEENRHLNDMYIFDTSTVKWSHIEYRSKPDRRRNAEAVVPIPPPRCGHTFTLVNSYFYVFGGYGGGVHHDDLWMFSPVTLTWIQVIPKESLEDGDSSSSSSSPSNLSTPSKKPLSVPSGRTGHSAIGVGNYLVIYGGYGAGIVYKDVWIFDTVNLTWKFINPDTFLKSEFRDGFVITFHFFLFFFFYFLFFIIFIFFFFVLFYCYNKNTSFIEVTLFVAPTARCNHICFPVYSSAAPVASIPSSKISFLIYGGISYESTVPRSDMWVCVFSPTKSPTSDVQTQESVDISVITSSTTDSGLSEESMAALLEDEEAEFIYSETKKVKEKVDESMNVVNNIDNITIELRNKINAEREKLMEKLLKEDQAFFLFII
jgi:hypothetical protein